MPIPIVCPSCGNNIQAAERLAGRTLRCHKCLNPFTVPNIMPAPMASFAPVPPPVAPAPAPFELTEEMAWNQPSATPAAPAGEVSWDDVPDLEDVSGMIEMPSTQDELPAQFGDEDASGELDVPK